MTRKEIEKKGRKWDDFRLNMPYGCDYDPETKTLQFFNREYTYVGGNGSVWRDVPKSCSENGVARREYFYGDGSKPLESDQNMESYRTRLGKFLDWTELENDKGFAVKSAAYYLEQTQ